MNTKQIYQDRNFSGLAIYLIYGMSHSKEEIDWSAKRKLQAENKLEGIRAWTSASNSVNMKSDGDDEHDSHSRF